MWMHCERMLRLKPVRGERGQQLDARCGLDPDDIGPHHSSLHDHDRQRRTTATAPDATRQPADVDQSPGFALVNTTLAAAPPVPQRAEGGAPLTAYVLRGVKRLRMTGRRSGPA